MSENFPSLSWTQTIAAFLRTKVDLLATHMNLAKQYGPLVKLSGRREGYFLIFDPYLAEDLLIKNEDRIKKDWFILAQKNIFGEGLL